MQLALKKLFTGEAAEVAFDYALDLTSTEWDGVKPFRSPVKVVGKVQHTAEGVLLSAKAAFDFCVPCDRCAEPIESQQEYQFTHELVQELHQEDNEDYVLVEQDTLDLDELMRADVLLELPTKNLCKPDCKGLCPKCGANRNITDCACDTALVDPRMEILKQLLD